MFNHHGPEMKSRMQKLGLLGGPANQHLRKYPRCCCIVQIAAAAAAARWFTMSIAAAAAAAGSCGGGSAFAAERQ